MHRIACLLWAGQHPEAYMPPFAGLVECETVGPMPENTTKPQLHVYDRCIQRYRWALMHLVISKLNRCLLAMVHYEYL